jgi:aminomethyltransferase
MGEIRTSGPGAAALLQRLLSNDVGEIAVGGAQYSVLCREDGGVLDDLFTYRLGAEEYLTVTNAANHAKDLAWLQRHAAGRTDVEVQDVADRYAMLAVQGPLAREIVQAMSDAPLPARFTVARRQLAGHEGLVCGTGYTGEDGVELLLDPEHAPAVWDQLLTRGAVPVGLAARDTLRLEVCYHLYGNDLMEERGPIEAGLGWCCKEATGFIGHEAVAAVRAAGPPRSSSPSRSSAPASPAGQSRRGRRRGHLGHDVAVPGGRDRDGLRARRPRRGRHGARDRRARPHPACGRRQQAPLPSQGGMTRCPTRATPRTCCTTPSTTGRASTATSPRSA